MILRGELKSALAAAILSAATTHRRSITINGSLRFSRRARPNFLAGPFALPRTVAITLSYNVIWVGCPETMLEILSLVGGLSVERKREARVGSRGVLSSAVAQRGHLQRSRWDGTAFGEGKGRDKSASEWNPPRVQWLPKERGERKERRGFLIEDM